MDGTGVPVVTPFDADGRLQTDALRRIVDWLADHVDFLVPCGSTGEAPHLAPDERETVIECVADATDLPVLAGTGHVGLSETRRATDAAAEAGADAALVVTPFYYPLDADETVAYYRAVADASPIPVYLYSVPVYTRVALDPETVADLATHPNVAGIKDSAGDVARLQRTVRLTRDADFDVIVGAGSVYWAALDAGVDGGILALANAVPEATAAIYRDHRDGNRERARERNAALQGLNRTMVAGHGVAGVKAAVEHRGYPAGYPRSPLSELDATERETIGTLVDAALE